MPWQAGLSKPCRRSGRSRRHVGGATGVGTGPATRACQRLPGPAHLRKRPRLRSSNASALVARRKSDRLLGICGPPPGSADRIWELCVVCWSGASRDRWSTRCVRDCGRAQRGLRQGRTASTGYRRRSGTCAAAGSLGSPPPPPAAALLWAPTSASAPPPRSCGSSTPTGRAPCSGSVVREAPSPAAGGG